MDDQFKRLVAVFGMPNRPDPKAFLDEFVKAVGTVWPEGVLERAVSRLIAEHEDPFWPMPGRLRALCLSECPMTSAAKTPQQIEADREKMFALDLSGYEEELGIGRRN